MPFYEKGQVRIHYEEVGSGPPLLIIPGGGLNATIPYVVDKGPFNALEAFRGNIAASPSTCATPRAAGPSVRWRSTGPGMRIRMTSSGCWTISASTGSRCSASASAAPSSGTC